MHKKIYKVVLALLFLSPFLLSGCTSLPKGSTKEQLIQRMAKEQKVSHGGKTYYCYSCNGQPTRTFTNSAGNTVMVYHFRTSYDFSGYCSGDGYSANCWPAYSQCFMYEERFELQGDILVDSGGYEGSGGREAAYSNACAGYNPSIPGGNQGGLDGMIFNKPNLVPPNEQQIR